MAAITIKDFLAWPKPNYINPETRMPLMLGCEIPLAVFMTGFVGVRMYARFSKRVLGWDDWTMFAAWIVAMTTFLCNCVSVRWGIGRHVWDVRIPDSVPLAKLALCFELLFAPCIGLTKISICLTYLRVFPFKTNNYFCYCTMAYVTALCITGFFAILFQCRPISANWDFFLADKYCMDRRAFLIASGALNSSTDLLVFLWPAKYIWNIQLPETQKKGLLACFTVGCLVCVAGACRIWYVIVYFNTYDTSWEGAPTYIISAFETNLAIICGCIPPTRLFFAQLFTRVRGSTFGGSTKHSKQSSSNNSKSRTFIPRFNFSRFTGGDEDGITLRSMGTVHETKGDIKRTSSRADVGNRDGYREFGSREEERDIVIEEPQRAHYQSHRSQWSRD